MYAIGLLLRSEGRLLQETIEAIVVERPVVSEDQPQDICLDKGYDNPTGEAAANAGGYLAHLRRIGEEKLDENREKRHPARRWVVVERTLVWMSKCRAPCPIIGTMANCERRRFVFISVHVLSARPRWNYRVFPVYSPR